MSQNGGEGRHGRNSLPMRLLVTIAHYFKQDPPSQWIRSGGSSRSPFAKIAALNAAIVALHRYFGPRRLALNPDDPQAGVEPSGDVLDIVVMTMRGANLLEWIGIDPAAYAVSYFDGEPQMLAFEAQRIMGERAGGYDLYAYMEDDLIVDDPAFFAKIAWFADICGPRAMLLPIRFEMAHTGTPAKVAIGIRLSSGAIAQIRRPGAPLELEARWNGGRQGFYLPNNPHVGFHAVTDAQLKLWMGSGSFYDRDRSWIDPLVSAATFAPGKQFALYHPAPPDPWFLEIEHFGTRFASTLARPDELFGEPPLLGLIEAAAAREAGGLPQALAAMAPDYKTNNVLIGEAAKLRHRLQHLENSRSELAKALATALWRKFRRLT
jgi:hypothetical protein